MRPSRVVPLVVIVAAAALHATPARAQWAVNGVNVCSAPWAQTQPLTLADGSGGAFIVWVDVRSGTGSPTGARDLYAQHLAANGVVVPGWPANGMVICDAAGDQTAPAIVTDGADGFFVAWQDHRGADNDLYLSRFTGAGALADGWIPGGNVVGSTVANQQSPCLATDGARGAFLAWSDSRDGTFDIRALRVDADGNSYLVSGQAGALQALSANGNLICGAAGDQTLPVAIYDGLGRAIVIWQDGRGASGDIYGARIQENGTSDVTWTVNGVLVSDDASGDDVRARAVSDDNGGAIVAWTSNDLMQVRAQRLARQGRIEWGRAGVSAGFGNANSPTPIARDGAGGVFVGSEFNLSFYIQRLDFSGAIASGWPVGGIKFTETGSAHVNALLEDGSGGAFAAFTANSSVLLQHVTGAGANVVGWPAAGQVICSVPLFYADSPTMASDGAGGAIVAWRDSRPGSSPVNGQPNDDIYAQRVLPMGLTGMYLGALTSASDVPADQGGWVTLNVQAPPADVQGILPGVTGYNVWRLVSGAQPAPLAAAAAEGGREWVDRARRESVLLPGAQAASAGFPPGSWQSLGLNAATQSAAYSLVVPTRNDSTSAGLATETYVVTIHTPSPGQYTVTSALSGHSADNLPPAMPTNLSGAASGAGVVDLAWNPNTESDLAGYSIYRGMDPAFVPQPGNRLGTPNLPAFHDAGFTAGAWYKVAARDRHGNESTVAVLGSGQVAGAAATLVVTDFLALPSPNPFTYTTTVSFGLARGGRTSLTVLDVAGRRVRTLVAGAHAAGRFSIVWRGDDDAGRPLAPGLYLVRLRSEGAEIVHRVALAE